MDRVATHFEVSKRNVTTCLRPSAPDLPQKKRRKSVQPPALGLDPEAASANSNDKQPTPDKQETDRK